MTDEIAPAEIRDGIIKAEIMEATKRLNTALNVAAANGLISEVEVLPVTRMDGKPAYSIVTVALSRPI